MKKYLACLMVGTWFFAVGCSDDTSPVDPAGAAGTAGAAGVGESGSAGVDGGGSAGFGGEEGVGGMDPGVELCIGVKPAPEAWQATPFVEGTPPSEICSSGLTCKDAPWPLWRLKDVQPQSCGYQATYGLDGFKGRPTIVVLLAGWCGFCQAQAVALQKMQLELEASGKLVHMAIVNAESAKSNQQELIDRCSFPIFQDIPEINAWGLQGGGKDDFFLYTSQGKLHSYLPSGGAISTNLSTKEGYENLKAIISSLP